MQVMRNEPLIKRRAKIGTYTTFAGLGVLLVGMVISFQQQYLWVSMVALVLGFVLSQYGNYNLRRWGRSPRPDEMIATALKGFDDRYQLYSWVLAAPHVLLTPQGVYTLTTRDQLGQVTVNGANWRQKWTLGRALLIFAQEGLGNPTREAIDEAARVEQWIKEALPETQASVQPVVLFVNEKVDLQVNEPTVPTLAIGALKKWLRGSGKSDNMKNADYRAVEQLFDAAVAKQTASKS